MFLIAAVLATAAELPSSVPLDSDYWAESRVFLREVNM